MSEIKPLKNVEVYSDGACSGNPGPGGWAAILRFGPHEKVLSGNVVNAFQQGWLANWQRRGWKTSDGKPVENQDLWRLMAIVVKKHEVEFIKVPGHADCEENNRCDALARAEIDKFRKINPDAAPQA